MDKNKLYNIAAKKFLIKEGVLSFNEISGRHIVNQKAPLFTILYGSYRFTWSTTPHEVINKLYRKIKKDKELKNKFLRFRNNYVKLTIISQDE